MKLKQKHFKIFRKECDKQLSRLGLRAWKIYYQFKKLDNCFGNANWDYSGKVATITLSTEFPKPFDNLIQQVKETALHECLEIFLGSISRMAGRRDYIQEDFDAEIHAVIRTLEKLLK
jgi:hypothetical protein